MSLQIFGDRKNGFSASYQDDGDDGHNPTPALFPCPFCGSADDLQMHNTHSPSYWVQCDNCGAEKHGKLPYGYAGGRIRSAGRCASLHAHARFNAAHGWNERTPAPLEQSS